MLNSAVATGVGARVWLWLLQHRSVCDSARAAAGNIDRRQSQFKSGERTR
jgi:hypothetical protein